MRNEWPDAETGRDGSKASEILDAVEALLSLTNIPESVTAPMLHAAIKKILLTAGCRPVR